MRSRPLMTLRLSTAPTQDLGTGPHGTRVTFPITGGSFEGDRLRGKVLPGADGEQAVQERIPRVGRLEARQRTEVRIGRRAVVSETLERHGDEGGVVRLQGDA